MVTIPKTQTGYGYLEGHSKIVKFENLPVPVPKHSQVLLKIEAAGLCHSDLALLAVPNPLTDKMVMGHEIAGQIVAVGEELVDNDSFALGKRYTVVIADSCGMCANCRAGKDNSCTGNYSSAYGITQDGGFQEYLLISNLRVLVEIPDGVSYEAAAITTDSVLTPYHAIQKVRHSLAPGKKVLVIGQGGLGLSAVQVLKNYGCHIVTTDKRADVKELSLKFGANEFFDNLESALEHMPESFDVIFDFCGYRETFMLAQKYIAARGSIVLVGLGNYKLQFFNYELARRNVTLYFNFGGTAGDQEEALKWVQLGKVQPMYTVKSMDEIAHYLEELDAGRVKGRIVFKPKL